MIISQTAGSKYCLYRADRINGLLVRGRDRGRKRIDAIERTLNEDYPEIIEIRPSWFLLLEKSGYSDKIRIYHSPVVLFDLHNAKKLSAMYYTVKPHLVVTH